MDFGKQFDGVVKSIRTVINPEYSISPSDQENPVNVRLTRMRASLQVLKKDLKAMSDHLATLETNISALMEEAQPLMKHVDDQSSTSTETLSTENPSAKHDTESSKEAAETTDLKSQLSADAINKDQANKTSPVPGSDEPQKSGGDKGKQK